MQDVATPNLTPELKTIALAALNAYLRAPALPDGRTPIEVEAELDQKRAHVIENRLKPLLAGYLAGSVFKRHIDGINKQNPLWGFGGIKGQMFFNMLIKTAEDTSEFDGQLKTVVREPLNEQKAIACLRNFKSYVTQSGQRFLDAGDSHSRPNPGGVPFRFLFFLASSAQGIVAGLLYKHHSDDRKHKSLAGHRRCRRRLRSIQTAA